MNQSAQTSGNQSAVHKYLFSSRACWYWIIIAFCFATAAAAFTIPEEAFPFVYARYVLGSFFVLFLPGYCLIRAVFPEKELDYMERVALSLGMSLILAPLTGLMLSFTPWGIRATPIILSLFVMTTILATIAVIRGYQAEIRRTE